MEKGKVIALNTFLILALFIAVSSCSSRLETPVTEGDSTITYPSKKANDISARITLCRKVDKKTGERIGTGSVFTLREKANLRAYVDLENCNSYGDKELMFHFDWIGPNGKTFYLKRFDLAPGDSTSTISSSVSISPEAREEGDYKLRIYYFRELIAEKEFEILPKFQFDSVHGDELTTKITLYRKKSKKTGKLIGEGTSFKIKNKAKVRALIEIENRFAYGKQELVFSYDWIGPDGKSFYGKRLDFYPNDSTSTIKSSISIPPDKRDPGKYSFRLYIYDDLIAEKEFELRPM